MAKRDNKITKYLIAFFIIMALSFIYKLLFKGDASGIIYSNNSEETSIETASVEIIETSEDVTNISIYICGAVNTSGVYEVPTGTILNDVIVMADGFNDNAATDYINLVYELRSNVSIYIPTYDEIPGGGYDDGIIYRTDSDDFLWGTGSNNTNLETATNGLVNINTASQDELMTLPGIGESTAVAIITYREDASFERIEDIMNISGIGESKFNRIRNLICVS